MIRAAVDPSVLVSAFIGNPEAGPSSLITAWRDRRFVLVVSPLLLDELTDVLGRSNFDRWSSEGRASAPGRSDDHRHARWCSHRYIAADGERRRQLSDRAQRSRDVTAVAEPDAPAQAHSAALRLYMEHRPLVAWRTEVERSSFEDGEWRFDVRVTNDRVAATVELKMSDAAAKIWAGGAQTPPSDQMAAEHVAVTLRGADWSAVRQRALNPTTVLAGRLRR